MLTIKKVKVSSVGRVFGAFYGFMGLLFGLFFAVFAVVGMQGQVESPMIAFLYGIGAIIFLPLMYGLMGFIGGLIFGFLYNFAASWFGGIQIETE